MSNFLWKQKNAQNKVVNIWLESIHKNKKTIKIHKKQEMEFWVKQENVLNDVFN